MFKKQLLLLVLFVFAASSLFSQKNTLSKIEPGVVNWDKTPKFSLPFPVIYEGPKFPKGKGDLPLNYGFSLISNKSIVNRKTMPKNKRFIIWGGLAHNMKQPIYTERSPWGNDMRKLHIIWKSQVQYIAKYLGDGERLYPETEYMCLDIEALETNSKAVLKLRKSPNTPKDVKELSDTEFILRYRKDMQTFYLDAALYFRKLTKVYNEKVNLSSYDDVPVILYPNQIKNVDYENWKTKRRWLNNICYDPKTGKQTPFFKELDFLSPCTYCIADHNIVSKKENGRCLAYMLFKVEANKLWSYDKPVIPFATLYYPVGESAHGNMVKPSLAEASAIFPMFSGADGLYLWMPQHERFKKDDLSAIDSYIKGLYRLSKYKKFFDGKCELVHEKTAQELYVDALPVWRGIVHGKEILVAAQNPYAEDTEETIITVSYKDWKKDIKLVGTEIYLEALNWK